jgi:hypothetical protein
MKMFTYSKKRMNKKLAEGLFQVGGVLVLAGAILYITRLGIAPYLYLIGSAMIVISLFFTPIDNENHTIHRLYIQQILGYVFLFVSAILMFVMHGNEWIVCLAIACVFILYSSLRISHEEKKEKDK